MIEVKQDIFVGNESEVYSLLHSEEWAFVHCCKHPFHCDMVGYKGVLPKTHPNYPFIIEGNRMALNLVDADSYAYDEYWHSFFLNMFNNAFNFIDSQLQSGKKVFIHCNQGESRGPSIALLYLISKGYHEKTFDETVQNYSTLYPNYKPRASIFGNIKDSWDYYTSI